METKRLSGYMGRAIYLVERLKAFMLWVWKKQVELDWGKARHPWLDRLHGG